MKLLKEWIGFGATQEQIKESIEKNKGVLKLKGVIQRADAENQNGRIYPREILMREIENYRKLVLERRAHGELDHCLLGSTEVLTDSGWKTLESISGDELVYTLNTDSKTIELSSILKKIQMPYSGKMYRLKNGKKLDIVMSPNHRVLLEDRDANLFYVSAKELAEKIHNKDSKISHSKVPHGGKWTSHTEPELYQIPGTEYSMPTKIFAALMGIWLSDGCASGNTNPDKKIQYKIQVTQKKEQDLKLIDDLLTSTSLPWTKRIKKDGTIDWTISNKSLHSYFHQFGKANSKFVPQEIKSWSAETQQVFLDWILLGDGRNRSSSATGRHLKELTSVSRQLVEDVSEVMFKLGYRPHIKTHIPNKDVFINGRKILKENCQVQYTVSGNVSSTYLDSRFVTMDSFDYSGDIFCLSTENRNFLIRSNGQVSWTGNSDEPVVNLKNVSHIITDIYMEPNGDVIGEVEVLRSPMGQILRTYIEDNVTVGISSRALGSVTNNGHADVVGEDLHFICWDFVSEPSTHGAFMFKESKEYDPKILNKIFKREDRIDRSLNELLELDKIIKGE